MSCGADPRDASHANATVRTVALAAQRSEDGVLRGGDVLILVHEYVMQPIAPLTRDGAGPVCRRIAQQTQGKLLQIGEVHAAQFALGASEFNGELPRQPKQRGHVMPRVLPVLDERVAPLCGRKGPQKPGFREELFETIADSLNGTARPVALVVIRVFDRLRGLGDFSPGRLVTDVP